MLPGQEGCVTRSEVGWLSTSQTKVTVPAGQKVTVQVRADAPATPAPRMYQARPAFVTDTPCTIPPVIVALTTR